MERFCHIVVPLEYNRTRKTEGGLLTTVLEWVFEENLENKHEVIVVGETENVMVDKRFDVVKVNECCSNAYESLEAVARFVKARPDAGEYEHVVAVVEPFCPYRPSGLLQRALDEFDMCGKPVITATRMCGAESRRLDEKGRCKTNVDKNKLFYDGRVLLCGLE